jgi:hypothetical protein
MKLSRRAGNGKPLQDAQPPAEAGWSVLKHLPHFPLQSEG